ncbi:MAG: tRNA (adenosine(37)-N6)-threonylcarbamoyltransferase complex ATPase subunit type 1 TsaE [Planctomycetota bacterium]
MGTSEISGKHQILVTSASPEETMDIGATFARLCTPNDVVGLTGTLGAGKTCFVRGMARGLEVEETEAVTSPTFVLLHQYSGRLPLYHYDAYRLQSAESMYEIGCEETFESGGVTAIEWADHVAECLPEEYFLWNLNIQEQTVRELTLTASGAGPRKRLPKMEKGLGSA